ncbi:hypothetical protein [Geodermatophilus sp. CPCC 205761]|uniref:hypothetical protein n=1 Tax=Geodermatophilus sp. CPCC 205761 TaxID=2936597 RepID=UPI003EEB53FE
MSTTSLSPTTAPAAGADVTAARFLAGLAVTLLPLLAAVIALELGWQAFAGDAWPVAGAVAVGWALGGAAWLCRRGWRTGAVLVVTGAPAAVLAGPAALGWLSPAGLVLWGPVSTVLAAALVMAADPLGPNGPIPARD